MCGVVCVVYGMYDGDAIRLFDSTFVSRTTFISSQLNMILCFHFRYSAKRLFGLFDVNGSGSLNMEEFRNGLRVVCGLPVGY